MDNTTTYFAGSNTCFGYRGCLDELLPTVRAKRALYIKGGPGVGKNTLMRACVALLSARGAAVECFECSGDPDSLDAVLAPDIGLLVADGTSPHVIDPRLPGAADGIVNLGVCLDEALLSSQREELLSLQADVTADYARAARYLTAAGACRDDSAAIYRACADADALYALISTLADGLRGERGGVTRRFVQAVTCKGLLSRIDSAMNARHVCFDLPFGAPAEDILTPLLHCARARGLSCTVYPSPLDGESPAHLRVGDTLYTTAALPDAQKHTVIYNAARLSRVSDALAFNRSGYRLLLSQAVECLAHAKALHDRMERLYVDAMDFVRWNDIKQEVLARIEALL